MFFNAAVEKVENVHAAHKVYYVDVHIPVNGKTLKYLAKALLCTHTCS